MATVGNKEYVNKLAGRLDNRILVKIYILNKRRPGSQKPCVGVAESRNPAPPDQDTGLSVCSPHFKRLNISLQFSAFFLF